MYQSNPTLPPVGTQLMLDLWVLSRGSFVREQGDSSGRILTLVVLEDKQRPVEILIFPVTI